MAESSVLQEDGPSATLPEEISSVAELAFANIDSFGIIRSARV